ncbi:uroporphyrinogen-III synthase [Litoreibacter sp.]|nr:uroporphyrinogen-III synthase [Litoreibacter sp.]
MCVTSQVTLVYGPYNAAFPVTRVLLTRPKDQSQAFADSLEVRFKTVISPVIETVFLKVDVDFQVYDGLVFTSQNGVRAYQHLGGPQGLKAYCVGTKTADCAAEAGLDAIWADNGIQALNALLATQDNPGRLLHLSGVHTAGEVQGNVTRIAIYDQVGIALTAEAQDWLATQGNLAVPLFSPRSAAMFQEQLNHRLRADLFAICLSDAVANVLDCSKFATTIRCDVPTAACMRDNLSEIFPA